MNEVKIRIDLVKNSISIWFLACCIGNYLKISSHSFQKTYSIGSNWYISFLTCIITRYSNLHVFRTISLVRTMKQSLIKIDNQSLFTNIICLHWHFYVFLKNKVWKCNLHTGFQNFQRNWKMFKCTLINSCNSFDNLWKIVSFNLMSPYNSFLTFDSTNQFFLTLEIDCTFLKFL